VVRAILLIGMPLSANVRMAAFVSSRQVGLVMQALGAGQKLGVDYRRANGAAYLAQRLANCDEKSLTGVGRQIPAGGDLNGVRQRLGNRLAISAATISSDNGDARSIGMSCLGGRATEPRAVGARDHKRWFRSDDCVATPNRRCRLC